MVGVKRKKHMQYEFGSCDWQNLRCEGKQNQAIFFAVLLPMGFEFSPGLDTSVPLYSIHTISLALAFPLSEKNICKTVFTYTPQIGRHT